MCNVIILEELNRAFQAEKKEWSSDVADGELSDNPAHDIVEEEEHFIA